MRPLTPRIWLFIGITLFAVIHLGLINHFGWVDTWRWWHIPARSPHFSDLRVITGASDSVERGFNPREINPGAPFGQRFNQTHVWLWLGQFGLRERHSTFVGLVMLAGYAVGIWWLAANCRKLPAMLLVPLLISPAALLAVERGTTDLSVFFLLALAGHVAARSMRSSLVVVLFGFVLKMFPLAGALLILREPRGRAWRLGLGVVMLVALFAVLNFRELVDIAHKTEKGTETSYGWAVLSLYLEKFPSTADWALPVRRLCAALAAAGGVLMWWWARRSPTAEEPPTRSLDFFRIGAGVYAGSFLLGASWDYRFIFCLFMIPQLVEWLLCHDQALRRISRVIYAVIIVAAWSRALTDWMGPGELGKILARTIEELAKWTLFFGCVHLLARTLPAWFKVGPSTASADELAPATP
jgi:hypothetical protein